MAPKAAPEPPPEEEEEAPPEPQTGEGSFMFSDRSTYSMHGGRATSTSCLISPADALVCVCAACVCPSAFVYRWQTVGG